MLKIDCCSRCVPPRKGRSPDAAGQTYYDSFGGGGVRVPVPVSFDRR